MARRRVFTREEELAFLAQAGEWRNQCVAVLTRARPQGPLYKAVEQVMAGVDSIAEVVAGDRRRFHQRDMTTPGAKLPAGREPGDSL